MKCLLKISIVLLVVCFFIGSANAYYNSQGGLTVSGTPPTTGDGLFDDDIEDKFNTAMAEAFNKLYKYRDQPKLAEGFANANSLASHAATQQGYQDYTLFAFTTGIMASAQLPSYNTDYYKDIDEKIKDDGDMDAGIGASLALINLGINAGFIYPGLYLNAKFGYISLNDIGDKVSVKNILAGVGANYTWMQSKSILAGLLKWRGISFGTGLLYNYNKTDVKIEMDDINKSVSGGGISGTLVLDPSFSIGVKSNTFLIPVDVTTSVQLLWVLNFTLGAGVDFTFGSTDIKLNSDGNVTVKDFSVPTTVNPGTFNVEASTKDKSPSFVHPRINSGIGFNIWMVKIDIPVIYYPLDKAIALGVTAGVVY